MPEIGVQADPVFQHQIPEACPPRVFISKLWQAGIGPSRGLRPIVSRFDASALDWQVDLHSKKRREEQDEETDGESITRPARQNLFAP